MAWGRAEPTMRRRSTSPSKLSSFRPVAAMSSENRPNSIPVRVAHGVSTGGAASPESPQEVRMKTASILGLAVLSVGLIAGCAAEQPPETSAGTTSHLEGDEG